MFSPWQKAPPRFLADLRGCPGKQHLASSTCQMSKGYSPGQGSGFMPSFDKHGLSSSHVPWARSLLSWTMFRWGEMWNKPSESKRARQLRRVPRGGQKAGSHAGVLHVLLCTRCQRRPLGRGTLPRGPNVVGEGTNLVTIWVKLHSWWRELQYKGPQWGEEAWHVSGTGKK